MYEGKVTVVELIEELEACDPDAEVRLAPAARLAV
jgi:hypothetical protein